MQFAKFALAAFSFGSAIAAPVVSDVPAVVDKALSAVANAKTIVDAQVHTITELTAKTPAGPVVAEIEESLLTIGTSVNGIIAPILVLSNNAVLPLNQGQLESVPQLVSDCQAVFEGVQTAAKAIVKGLPQDVLKQVQPELQWVLSATGPVVKPLVAFTTTAVPGTAAVYTEVNGALAKVQGIANNLVIAPVNGLVGGLLDTVL
ncbi:hypothetical protein F4808DRAFT_462047 [Astrocystis sublimbata]|nr:hypothetical protein F4808DRAFT_462047 [Astrocystis sublimbata]